MNWYIYKVYYFIKPIDVYIIKNSTSLHYNKKKNTPAPHGCGCICNEDLLFDTKVSYIVTCLIFANITRFANKTKF